jgi:hypothetical protein
LTKTCLSPLRSAPRSLTRFRETLYQCYCGKRWYCNADGQLSHEDEILADPAFLAELEALEKESDPPNPELLRHRHLALSGLVLLCDLTGESIASDELVASVWRSWRFSSEMTLKRYST